jgi:hypothetical protein
MGTGYTLSGRGALWVELWSTQLMKILATRKEGTGYVILRKYEHQYQVIVYQHPYDPDKHEDPYYIMSFIDEARAREVYDTYFDPFY